MLFQSTPLWEGRHFLPEQSLASMSFNPRPCGRGDIITANTKTQLTTFQSTPLWEGRRTLWMETTVALMFQSTPLWEGRLVRDTALAKIKGFNPRPCGRGDLGEGNRSTVVQRFNPRPCGRGDQGVHLFGVGEVVSIHAPVGGATCGPWSIPCGL